MSLVFDSVIRISLVLLFGLAATLLLRRRSAAVRHWLLATSLMCAAALPVLTVVAPAWSLGLAAAPASMTTRLPDRRSPLVLTETESATAGTAASGPASPVQDAPAGTAVGAVLVWLWLAGAVVNGAMLSIGLGRLMRVAARAREITGGIWIDGVRQLEGAFGLPRPVRLLQGDHPSLLVTWGLVAPRILLPPGAATWSADRIRVVLAHECAHIRRRDWALQMGAEILRAVFSFNPLLWLACRRLRQESEQACDDTVMNLGIEARDYATHLLDLARTLTARSQLWLPASAIAARPSSLHMRITAMLTHSTDRHPITRLARTITAIALLAVTVPVAGFAQNTFATISGSITDPSDALLPGVTLVLTDTQKESKHEVRSGRTGRFEFVGVPAGEYVIEARLPGFATGKATVTVSGQDLQRDLRLEVGSLQETVMVRGDGDGQASAVRRGAKRAQATCNSAPASGGIGGQIRPPVRIADARPQYPPQLRGSDVEGTVILEGTIGTTGSFRELRVASTPHPALASAALDAVSQWEWDETLLNCVPVEVKITVHVHFSK